MCGPPYYRKFETNSELRFHALIDNVPLCGLLAFSILRYRNDEIWSGSECHSLRQ